ncbi:MAG: single-stranded-DNA-specific exonuclease RecJ [Bacillota bacterium]
MKKKWVSYNKDYNILPELVKEFGISELVARVLVNRDIDTLEKASYFISYGIEKLRDPFEMKDMSKAVDRIIEAIELNQKICIFGDYDVDGVTSTVIAVKILRSMDADVTYYIPNRVDEGYGLNIEAIENLAEEGIELIITVDCGIRSLEVVNRAKELGIDMIITDHHECGEELPDAYCVINPHRADCSYPFKELAGVGVCFKLVDALATELGCRDTALEMLDIVAVGTIADIVYLVDENRIIVKHGLEKLQNTENIGLRALLDICGLKEQTITAYNVAFMIAPRINAAGRIANASLCVELLLTDDYKKAYEIAKQLDNDNKERQSIESEILTKAITKIERDIDISSTKVLVLDDKDWHVGVIGIVASKLVERYNLPAVLISRDNGIGKGSARSVSNFNIYEALDRCSDLFIKFGGHELAAGITLSTENIDAFRQKVNEVANEILKGEPLIPELKVDYRLTPSDYKLSTVKQLEMLEPYGAGNPAPAFVYRDLKVISSRTVGNDSKHLLLTLNDGVNEIKAIGFNLGTYNNVLSFGKKVDIICSMECNLWNDIEQLQLKIKDIKITI